MICLGDILERIIYYSTFSFGKRVATKVANLFGFESCGCSERQQRLNEWSGCKKGIKL